MKISFFTRGSKLQVRLPQNGIYVRLSTGIVIPPYLKFAVGRQLVSGTTEEATAINSDIARHRKFISGVLRDGLDLKKEYEAFLKPVEEALNEADYEIVNMVKQYYQKTLSGEIKTKKGKRAAYSTTNNYKFAMNLLFEYSKIASKLDLMDYNMAHVQDLPTKTRVAERWEAWWNGFIKHITNSGLNINSKSTVMNVINVMILHYQRKLFILLPPIPKIKSYEIPIVVLPDGFVTKFLNDTLYNRLDSDKKFVWEVCATMMFSTLRISDAVTLKWENFTDNKSSLFMNKWNLKTGALSTAPFPKKLENVFRENMARNGDIYTPVVGKVRSVLVYTHIRNIFAMYPELHQVVTASAIDSDGVVHTKSKPLYEWVTPHMLRKTAITNMGALGMEDSTIKLMSGHTANSKHYERYKAYNNRRHNKDMEKYLAELNNG